MDLKQEAVSTFKSILKNVNPKEFLPEIVKWNSSTSTLTIFDQDFSIGEDQKIYVIGTGKASSTMAEAMESILGDSLGSGIIIAPPDSKADLKTIKMLLGSHPLPDDNSINSTKELLNFIKKIPDGSYVINLISGGTSALLCHPVESVSVDEIRQVYNLLLESGASIHEVNTVRKTVSLVKGGRMLDRLKHTTLLDLVISDVPDDDLRFIGSGPTTAQEISFSEAKNVAEKYEIWERLPETVRRHISAELDSSEKSIIQIKDFDEHHAWIVSSAAKVAEKTESLLTEAGFETELIHPAWTGLIEDFEAHIAKKIDSLLENKTGKQALVFYGECTVKVTGGGLGGRNQELALRMAKRLKNLQNNIAFLSAGTDGIDGPTDAAGGVVDHNTYPMAKSENIDPDKFIEKNDSYHFFEQYGGHIITGPTGNNVMDIQIVLAEI
jgi:glycerate 2-kinase